MKVQYRYDAGVGDDIISYVFFALAICSSVLHRLTVPH